MQIAGPLFCIACRSLPRVFAYSVQEFGLEGSKNEDAHFTFGAEKSIKLEAPCSA
jgi:hypothetical protein